MNGVAFLMTAIVAGPALAATPLSVRDVIASHRSLDGQTILVYGWLGECEPLSCGLFASREEALNGRFSERMLSIGSAPTFDRVAQNRGPAEILLKARVHARCFGDAQPDGSKWVCMDRADQLQPIKILRFNPAKSSNRSK